jgi:predicted dehydrogenase
MVGIGVIGYGYWGPNLVRNFADVPGARVVAISDLSADRLARAQVRCPTARTTRDHRELLADPAVDAVVIATPVSTHFDLALEALRAGKHVLVEKPLASTSDQAARLVDEAVRRNRVLLVDHTFLYTGAVRKMRELVANGEMGEIYYYDSVRVNLGLFQHDVNVIWDLAVHDLSVMDHVLGERPCAVSATGVRNIPGKQENIAYLTLFFDSPLIAHVHVNWLAPVKIRRTLIGGSRKMIVYDDLEPSEKVKVYDKGVTLHGNTDSVYKTLVGYRTGDMWAPHLDTTEALHVEARHFLACIEQGECPVSDGEAALRVVQLLEAATRSIAQRGSLVELKGRRMAA